MYRVVECQVLIEGDGDQNHYEQENPQYHDTISHHAFKKSIMLSYHTIKRNHNIIILFNSFE